MPIIASEGESKNFTLAPAGNHVARCVQVIDKGTQEETFPGKAARHVRKVLIGWELPNAINNELDEPAPFLKWQEYTLNLWERAKLCQHLEAWRGRPFTEDEKKSFDLVNILDKGCMLNIIHRTSQAGRQYAQVTAVTPLPQGVELPPRHGELIYFAIDEWDSAVFDSFTDFLKDQILASPEGAEAKAIADGVRPPDDDFPPVDESENYSSSEQDNIPFIWLIPFVIGCLNEAVHFV